MLSKSWPIKRK